MREIIVVLVQAITDLFDCLPKDMYATEKVMRMTRRLRKCSRNWPSGGDAGRATRIELTVAQIGLAGSNPLKLPRKRLRNTPCGRATLFGV